ncbi:MAG: alpha/beta hydrolase [Hyphomicrobiaceae bacterium]
MFAFLFSPAATISTARASDVQFHEFTSVALGRTIKYSVYRPSAARGETRFPVLYLLHGAGGSERSWPDEGRIKEVADALIENGSIQPMLIVMPAAGGCWWIDSPDCLMETMFWSELEPLFAARTDVASGRGARAIAGVSAGGHGAIRLSLTRQDRFAAIAALSPAIYAEMPPEHSNARTNTAFLDKFGHFDPLRWQAANYTCAVAAHPSAQHFGSYYIVAGDHDEYNLDLEAVRFHRHMLALSHGTSQLRILDGDHTWRFWSRVIGDALRHLSAGMEPLPSTANRLVPSRGLQPLPIYGRQ